MPKTMSSGVVMLNERGEVLLCHATETHHWDIPKGMGDPGETARNTALRELHEETGIVLPPDRLVDLGAFDYRRDKSLYLFGVRVSTADVDVNACVCTSMFPSRRHGKPIPEMDDFAWIAPGAVSAFASGSLSRLFMRALPLPALFERLPAPSRASPAS